MKQGGLLAETKQGFTIVETLIVLAVTSALFIIATVMISGRTAKTEFQVTVRDVQTRIQKVINETGSGYYPASQDFACSTTAIQAHTSPYLSFSSGTSKAQGAHENCIFIGKTFVIDSSKLYIYSLAGVRTNSDGSNVTTPQEAHTTAIARGVSVNNSGLFPDLTEVVALPYDVKLVGADAGEGLTDVAATPIYAFSVMSSLASTSATPAQATQNYNLYGFNGNFVSGRSQAEYTDNIGNEQQLATAVAFPLRQQVRLCLKSGGTDQLALLTIGGGGSTAVRVAIQNGSSQCSV